MVELTFTSRRDGPVGILTLRGEARFDEVSAWRKAGEDLAAAGARHLLIEVSALAFADSASMGAMIHLQNRFQESDGRVILVGAPVRLRKMISDMGLSGHLHIAPDEPTARAALVRP